MHHTYLHDCWMTKIQLSFADLIDYRMLSWGDRIDQDTGKIVQANIETDTFCGFNTSVYDSWFTGFGEMCYVCDNVVLAINSELSTASRNRSTGFVDKLLETLPESIRSKLLPLTSRVTLLQMFDSEIPDHKECNPNCDPMPLPPNYLGDDNHIRQVEDYIKEPGANQWYVLPVPDLMLNAVVRWLNFQGHCSPWVTSINSTIDRKRPEYQEAMKNVPSLFEFKILFNYLKLFLGNLYELLTRAFGLKK